MAEDEVLMMVFMVCYALVAFPIWLFRTTARSLSALHIPLRRWFVFSPLLFSVSLCFLLSRFASFDVREDFTYLLFYTLMGYMWMDGALRILHWFNLSARDDAIHRRNKAAAIALLGAQVGTVLSFAGANFGDGPSFAVVLFCGTLSTGSLLLLWYLLDRINRVSDTITVDRDVSAGYRSAGFFIGMGLVLGRAVAGDWLSIEATVRDFVLQASPTLPMLAIAMVLEGRYPPRVSPSPLHVANEGIFPALLLPAMGVLIVTFFGHW